MKKQLLKNALMISVLIVYAILFAGSVIVSKKTVRNGKADPWDVKAVSEKKFTNSEVDELKKTTTIFLLKDSAIQENKEIESAIKSVWNLTDLKFISYSKVSELNAGNYSYFELKGSITTTTKTNYQSGTSFSYSNSHFYLVLSRYYNATDKKGKSVEMEMKYCRLELYPAFSTYSIPEKYKKDEVMTHLFNEGQYRNWFAAMLRLYVEDLQNNLKKNERKFLFEDFQNEKELAKLKKDTLFIPDYVLIKFNSGREDERHDEKSLMKDYKYPYKIVTTTEINNIVSSNRPVFILDYIKSSTDKFVRVFKSGTGMIYQDYEAVKYNIDQGDFGEISKIVSSE